MDSVALVEYKGDIEESLKEGIQLIGGFGVLKSPFIIKPNICATVDGTGYANTDFKIVEAMVRLVLEKYKKQSIRIVESDSGAKFAEKIFR